MIVITTPTGNIGKQVLDHILASEEAVRVIVRDPSRLSLRARERAEIVQGEHNHIDVVTQAFAGADCVFWLVPPNPRADSVKDYYLNFTRPACEAIQRQGVKRVVGVSTLGEGYSKTAGQMSAALAMDELFQRTGVNYRSLRMPFFMENLLHQVDPIKNEGIFFLPNAEDRPLPTVATRDIAATAAKLLLDDTWTGQDAVPVVGPDNLSPNQMAQIMSEVLGRDIRFQQITYDAYKATMVQYGMTEAWVQGLVEMAMAQNDGAYDMDGSHTSSSPTSFRRWCEDMLKPAILN